MLLGLFDILLRIFGIFESRSSILINFNQIRALLMHLGVDLLGNVIDISHELLNVVQLFLPLLNDVLHVGSLALHLQLLNIQLLFLQQIRTFITTVQARGTLVVHQSLSSLDQIQMLLHLEVQLLALLLELVDNFGQTSIIRLLLLLLLAL